MSAGRARRRFKVTNERGLVELAEGGEGFEEVAELGEEHLGRAALVSAGVLPAGDEVFDICNSHSLIKKLAEG